jgi:hypothetical protein
LKRSSPRRWRKTRRDVTRQEVLDALEKLVDDETAGDPSSADRWVNRSRRKLATAKTKFGHNISHVSAIRLMKNIRKKYLTRMGI